MDSNPDSDVPKNNENYPLLRLWRLIFEPLNYLARLVCESWDNLGLFEIIIDPLATIMAVISGLLLGFTKSPEKHELYRLAFCYSFWFLVFLLLGRLFLLTPYKIIKAQDREKEEFEKQLKEKLSREQKGKLLHDAILDLQTRIQELNGAKRYFDLTGEIKSATYVIVNKIYDDLRDGIGIPAQVHS